MGVDAHPYSLCSVSVLTILRELVRDESSFFGREMMMAKL